MGISTELSNFHKMITAVLKSSFITLKSKETYYWADLALSLDRTNKGYDFFEEPFMKTLNRHGPRKTKFGRHNKYNVWLSH